MAAPDDRPVVVLYLPRELPLLRDGMLPLHPLPDAMLDRPCWVFSRHAGVPDAVPLGVLPEGPVDDEHHPHLWAMLRDVNGVMTHDRWFRELILGHGEHGTIRFGYHADAGYDRVRRVFAEHARVIDADALVRARHEMPRPGAEVTLARVDAALRLTPRSGSARVALRDWLHGGGGEVPPPLDRAPPSLAPLFAGASPIAFNEVHLRALDHVAQTPARLDEVEQAVSWVDPAMDLHRLWRDLLLARGVDEEDLERSAVRAWVYGDPVSSRAWWLLDRAARDPGAFLRRHEAHVDPMRLQRRLLFAAWGTWRLPRFRALGDALVAQHGHRLPTEAYLDVLTSAEPAHAAEVVTANLPRVLRRRGASDARRIRDVLERPAPAEPGDG